MGDVLNKLLLDKGTPIFEEVAFQCGLTADEKGFWGEPEPMDKYVAKLGLIHSEVTEILEALRKNQGADKVTEEFADVFIRALDLHAKLAADGYATDDLYEVILSKMNKNQERPPKHGHVWG